MTDHVFRFLNHVFYFCKGVLKCILFIALLSHGFIQELQYRMLIEANLFFFFFQNPTKVK